MIGISLIVPPVLLCLKLTNLFAKSICSNVKERTSEIRFAKASQIAGLPKVTPHVLRASWVTLAKKQGVPDSEVMKVTGHTSSKMIYAYDKTSSEENYSKKLVLI